MYKIKNGFLLLLLLLPACFFAQQDVKEIDSITQAQVELAEADQQTLVVFDIDDTLTKPTDTALQFLWQPDAFSKDDANFMIQLKEKLGKHLASMGPVAAGIASKKIWSQQLLKSSYIPVESSTVGVVKKLQERGVRVIALTACRPGARGDITSLQQWRFDELKKVGIDLSGAFAAKEMVFEKLPVYEGYHPMFYQGILMATLKNFKGKVLGAFLDRIEWTPKKVIFFDDRKDYVEGVAQEMHARSIACQGYWYRATMKQKPKLKRDIVQKQFDYLMQHDVVLSEGEAAAITSGL